MSREKGFQAETVAAEFLKGLGYSIRERNFNCRMGEIDIIAQDGETLVFVEVKARASAAFGLPQETVTFSKRRKIIKTALLYSQRERLDCPMRFDVVAIQNGAVEHISGAFDAFGA